MHCKSRYKIRICSVILGKLESFQNYKGSGIIFPKILDVHLKHQWVLELQSFLSQSKLSNFFVYIIEHISKVKIFEDEKLGFFFSMKKSPTWGVKCEKLNFGKL